MECERNDKKRAVFVGMDERLDAALEAAVRDGYLCERVNKKTGNEKLSGDLLVLPVPAQRNGLFNENELLTLGRNFKAVSGGMLPETLANELSAGGTRVFDYMKDEEYVLKNARITAEIATCLLQAETKSALCDLTVAVTGDGRIGTAMNAYLSAFGANVRLYSRKGTEGTCPYEDLPRFLENADFLVNTVPAPVIDPGALSAFPANARAIELAGKPGGFTEKAEILLGARLLKLPGLPGKYAPKSAGIALWRAILRARLCEKES